MNSTSNTETATQTSSSTTGTAVASDNCDDDVTVSYADTTVAGTGNNSVITRVWTATDDNSNSATYTQTITVVDTTAPTFTTGVIVSTLIRFGVAIYFSPLFLFHFNNQIDKISFRI